MKKLSAILLGIIAAALILLKLTGYITWDWVYVVAPLWIPTIFELLGYVLESIGTKILIILLVIIGVILFKTYMI